MIKRGGPLAPLTGGDCLFRKVFPHQRELMGSSRQNSSGVHWRRRRVRFNEVPEKGQVQQGSGEGSGEGSGRLWCRARSGSTGFRRRFRRRSGRLWCKARSGSTGFREALVQSQVRFNRVPARVPKKVPGGFGAEPGQVQQGSGEGSGRLWCRARSGSTGLRRRFRRRSGRLWCRARSGSTGSTGFPALGFAARFRKICKNETLRLLGIPLKIIFIGEAASLRNGGVLHGGFIVVTVVIVVVGIVAVLVVVVRVVVLLVLLVLLLLWLWFRLWLLWLLLLLVMVVVVVVGGCRWLSVVVGGCRWLSVVVRGCRLSVVGCLLLLLVVVVVVVVVVGVVGVVGVFGVVGIVDGVVGGVGWCWLSVVVGGCRWLSVVVGCCRLLVVVGCCRLLVVGCWLRLRLLLLLVVLVVGCWLLVVGFGVGVVVVCCCCCC